MTSSFRGLPPISDGDFDLSAGLGDESEDGELRAAIVDEIRECGRITFRRFMELALYSPVRGYYMSARERIGRGGDYVTSPEISPLFGYAIGRQIAEFWRNLGEPARFAVTEYGAGSGRLAGDVLRWQEANAPSLYAATTYTLVERSRSLQGLQAERLAVEIQRGKVLIAAAAPTDAPTQEAAPGCVLANELLDSLPVHRVSTHDGALIEIYVGLDGDRFSEAHGQPSTPAIGEYFRRLGLLPGEGCVAEVNLDAAAWLRDAAARIAGGYLLILDYGYPAERKYARWRRSGTLLCYHRHQAGEDPYQMIGRQDLTSHVDFTSLAIDARATGLSLIAQTDQARFLLALGLQSALRPSIAGEQGMQEYYARRRAVETLIDPAGLGRIGVLLLGKGVGSANLLGFADRVQGAVVP